MKKIVLIPIIASIIFSSCEKTDNDNQNNGIPGPTEGLVAYFPFNGNANDESGNGNDGIVHGATLTEDRLGRSDSAYSFDGIDDYIICDSALSVINLEELTISVWVYYYGHQGYVQDVILSTLESNASGGYQIHLEDWERKIMLVYRDGNLPHHYTKASTVIATNKWYHFVAVLKYVDSVLTGSVYINGNLDNTVIQHDTIYYGLTENLRIGSNCGTHNGVATERYFRGKLDNIRIYNRGLKESEILELYLEAECTPW